MQRMPTRVRVGQAESATPPAQFSGLALLLTALAAGGFGFYVGYDTGEKVMVRKIASGRRFTYSEKL